MTILSFYKLIRAYAYAASMLSKRDYVTLSSIDKEASCSQNKENEAPYGIVL